MKKSNIPFLILFLLFFFSFCLRLALLRNGPFDIDSLNLTIQSAATIETLKLHSLFGPGYPLIYFLGILSILVSKFLPAVDPITAVNGMSAFFGSLCIPLFYKLILELLQSHRSAFMGALILSVCPIFLDISLYGMGHTPTLFFLMLGILYLFYFHQENQNKYLWLSSVCFGLMGSARFQDLILMFIPISYFYFFGVNQSVNQTKKFSSVFQFIKFSSAIFAIVILFHLPILLTQGYKNQLMSFITMGTNENFRGYLSPSLLRSLRYFINNFTWAGVFTIIFGLIFLIRQNSRLGIFCSLWILIPLFFYGNLTSTAPRFFVTFLPAMIIPQVYLLNRLMSIKKIFFFITIAVTSAIIFIPFFSAYPKIKLLHERAYIPDFARWISEQTEADAVIIAADESLFIEYFGHRKIFYRPLHHIRIPQQQIDEFKNQLDQLIEQKIPVYITLGGLFAYNPNKEFSSMIRENYKLDAIGSIDYLSWHRSPFQDRIKSVNGLFKLSQKE